MSLLKDVLPGNRIRFPGSNGWRAVVKAPLTDPRYPHAGAEVCLSTDLKTQDFETVHLDPNLFVEIAGIQPEDSP